MTPELPEPLARYFAEENLPGPGSVEALFAPEATVYDERRTHTGWAAIRAWKEDAKAKYQYRTEPLDCVREGDTLRVAARLSGNFPGSPVTVTQAFTLADGKIAALDIR